MLKISLVHVGSTAVDGLKIRLSSEIFFCQYKLPSLFHFHSLNLELFAKVFFPLISVLNLKEKSVPPHIAADLGLWTGLCLLPEFYILCCDAVFHCYGPGRHYFTGIHITNCLFSLEGKNGNRNT